MLTPVKKISYVLTALLATLVSLGVQAGYGTIFDIVKGSGRFDELEKALRRTGLDLVLDGQDEFTVFAPTDNVSQASGVRRVALFGFILFLLLSTPFVHPPPQEQLTQIPSTRSLYDSYLLTSCRPFTCSIVPWELMASLISTMRP